MKFYTVGFLFSENRDRIILVKKNRPDWQIGKLNGIGGHIEEDELPLDCMIREFEEEAGVLIPDWEHFCTITDKKDFQVEFFRSFKSEDTLKKCRTVTDEIIINTAISDIPVYYDVIENLKWIIPLALSKDNGIPLYIEERKC